MSTGSPENPFASPEARGLGSGEWQGTPVPPPPPHRDTNPAPPYVPAVAAPPPPHSDYAQAPPPPGAYVSPEATAYPSAPKPYGAHYPPEPAAGFAQAAAPVHAAPAQVAPLARPPVSIPPPPGAQQHAPQHAIAYPPPPPGYGYGYAPQYAPGADAKNWMGITSLVLSLTTVIFGITAIGGIVLGHLGLAAAKRGEATNRGLALAGLIVGYVLLGLGLLFFGLVFIAALMDESSYS